MGLVRQKFIQVETDSPTLQKANLHFNKGYPLSVLEILAKLPKLGIINVVWWVLLPLGQE